MHDGTLLSQHHPRTLTRSRHLVHESRLLMNDSWRAIAKSRRCVLRRPVIAGGSDDDHLRTTIRVRLADGTLPKIDGRAWAGTGLGTNTCACCGDTIKRADREFEPQAADGLHAHGPCFTIWLAESLGLRVYAPLVDRDRHRETASGS